MKTCKYCGTQVEDTAKFCIACGAGEFSGDPESQPAVAVGSPVQPAQAAADINDNGNVLAGIVGAFLFALIGGFLYFVIYQAGIIAGICGLVIFVLANFGYGLLARTQNKLSLVGLISAIAATVVMIFVAEYVSIAYAFYNENKEYLRDFFEAIRILPDYLVYEEFFKEMAMAYLFAFIASIGNIVNIIKARKAAK